MYIILADLWQEGQVWTDLANNSQKCGPKKGTLSKLAEAMSLNFTLRRVCVVIRPYHLDYKVI